MSLDILVEKNVVTKALWSGSAPDMGNPCKLPTVIMATCLMCGGVRSVLGYGSSDLG